jgi:LysR family cys regulon transcriptional activator
MQLRQLLYVQEIARHNFSVSAAASAINTSQPGVSNQVQLLEEELGLKIFERHGKRLLNLTPFGQSVLALANRVLLDVDNIHKLAEDSRDDQSGILSIGTTHTQARYALAPAIKEFTQLYPDIHLKMVQGTPSEITKMAETGELDIVIATEAIAKSKHLSVLPCYNWNRSVIVPANHPLLSEKSITIEQIAEYPILSYMQNITGRAMQDRAFQEHNLTPNIVFTATDADVIKTYVEMGLGIGIIASMAFNPIKDLPLQAIDASHLFHPSTTLLGYRADSYLRAYSYAFIECFAPHLTRKVIDSRQPHYKAPHKATR